MIDSIYEILYMLQFRSKDASFFLHSFRYSFFDHHFMAGSDMDSHHYDCAEDFGDWQSKWTEEPWV